jgi:drug/metabolite transporter (DMT)-like permease
VSAAGHGGLFSTTEGSRPEAFGPVEWALLLGTATIWGSSYLWIELGLRGLHPGVVSATRVLLGLIAISLVPRSRRPIDPSDRGRLWVLGVGWFGLPMITFPIAQDLGVATSVVGMLNGAMPLLTTFFASVLLRRVPRPRQIFGVVIGFAGLLAISAPEMAGADATALGVAIILGTMAVGSLLVSVLVPMQQRYGALPVLRRTLSIALLFTLPFAAFGLPRSSLEPVSLLAMLPLGLLSTGLAFVLWTTLVGRTGASRGSVVSYLVPVVAIILGVAVLAETIAPLSLLGTGLVLLGAWAVSGRERPDGPPPPTLPLQR